MKTTRASLIRRAARGRAGFSLIEMIGVLALMALCAGILSPAVAQRVSRMKGAQEAERLAVLAEGLERHVELHQEIPGAGTWAVRVASMTGIPVQEVERVIPHEASTARACLVLLSIPDAGAGDVLWQQASGGVPSVSDARLILLSVHRPGLALPVSSGIARSRDAFESIWTWSYNPATDAPPAGWPSEWQGNGKYLHVCRVNLMPLFRRVTFNNTQHPAATPWLQIGQGAAAPFSAATYDALYLRGTLIRLHGHSENAASQHPLQLTHTVQGDVNFVYEDDRWHIP